MAHVFCFILLLTCVLSIHHVVAEPLGTKFKPTTLNPHILDILPPGDLFNIKDPVLTNGINLTIRFPHAIFTLDKSFEDRSRDTLGASLPQILQQFGIPSDQIQERVNTGIPLLLNGIQELLSEEKPVASRLRRRDILGSLFGWAKDAGCALVAAGGLPLFLLAAADFTAENTNGVSTTPDQDFFLFPLYANLAHDGPVKLYYQATRAPFFKGTSGTTFNRNVFTPLSPFSSFSESNFRDFEILTQTLIHEFKHVDQYRRKGYDITAFGYEYLFQWCSNGGYAKITLEVDAYATQNKMDGLLLFDWRTQQGNEFFQVWRTRNLGPALGNPVVQMYSTVSTNPFNIRELRFERGVLQIKDGPCFRTFSSAEISFRDQSNCNPNIRCRRNRRDALQKLPGGGRDDDPGPGPGPTDCDDAKEACSTAKAAWNSLSSRAWTCDLRLPTPAPPPPPPKAGCPPTCDIIQKVPHTSKSCRFDEPPAGCDWAFADENNKKCRVEIKRCSAS